MKSTMFFTSFFVLLLIIASDASGASRARRTRTTQSPQKQEQPSDDQKLKLALQKATAAVKRIDTTATKLKAKPQLDTAKATIQAKFQKIVTAAQKAISQVTRLKGTPPAMSRMTWEILVGQIMWETQAQRNASKIKALNTKLGTIAKKLRNKFISQELAAKYQKAVTTITTEITKLGGQPVTTWQNIESSLKRSKPDDTQVAKRTFDKAMLIKKALYAKAYPAEKVTLLKKNYSSYRYKVLRLDPQMGGKLLPAEQLPIHSKSSTDSDPKKVNELKFTTSLKKLATINKLLKQGVTTAELDEQKTKFDKEHIEAQRLKKLTQRPDPIPSMVQAKIVTETQAIKKYIDAVASVDKDLTTKKMGILSRSPVEIEKLQVQRTKLIKKAQAIDPHVTFPPLPEVGQKATKGSLKAQNDETAATTTKPQSSQLSKETPSIVTSPSMQPQETSSSELPKGQSYAKVNGDDKNAIRTEVVKSGIFGQNKKIVQLGPDGKPIQQVYTQKEMDELKKKTEKETLKKGGGNGASMGMGMGAMALGGGMGMGAPVGMGMGAPMMMAGGGMMAGGMVAGGMMAAPVMAGTMIPGATTATGPTGTIQPVKASDFPNLSTLSQQELADIEMPTITSGALDSLIVAAGFYVIQPGDETAAQSILQSPQNTRSSYKNSIKTDSSQPIDTRYEVAATA